MAYSLRRPFDELTSRDGYLTIYGLDRIPGFRLREMFLPKMTPEGKRALDNNFNFVRAQMKHYDVEIDESKFHGNGTNLLKRALRAGRFDQVPDHILELEKELHQKWLSDESVEEIARSPNPYFLMEKCFLTDGKPDCNKTPAPICIPLNNLMEEQIAKLVGVSKGVTGLHHKHALGRTKRVLFMGWIQEEVEKAASEYPEREVALKAERIAKRNQAHMDYLASRVDTPVGSYIVDCDQIERQWPDLPIDMRIEIHTTDTPGLFQGDFDFGVAEGVMFLSSNRSTLDRHCARADHAGKNGRDDSDPFYDDEFDFEPFFFFSQARERHTVFSRGPEQGIKRGSESSDPTTTKRMKLDQGPPLRYFLQLKHRQKLPEPCGIDHTPRHGTIEFHDRTFVGFGGNAFMCPVGTFSFVARKVSDVPSPSGKNWLNYSEREYEKERLLRLLSYHM